MKVIPMRNHEDACAIVCSDCGRGMLAQDIGKKWNKCEFCNDPICISCSHYMGALVQNIWRDYISVRRVCKKCVIKF